MANRYWVGGTAAWDGTAGSKWALTSGGTGGQAIPTSADDVFFDAASGTVTVTLSTGNTGAKSVDFTGFTGTLAGSGAISIAGSLTLSTGMTRTYTGTVSFTGTGTVTLNGKGLASITVNGSGITVTPAGTVGLTGNLSVTLGTWDANTNNPAHNIGTVASLGNGVRTINMGSGLWTLSSQTQPWVSSGSNFTFNKNTANLVIAPNNTNPASPAAFSTAGLIFNGVTVSGVGTVTFGNAFTASALTVSQTGGSLLETRIPSGVTVTVSSFSMDGGILRSTATGSAGTLSVASGSPSITNTAIRDIAFTGGATWAAASSFDLGNNSGITITGSGAAPAYSFGTIGA